MTIPAVLLAAIMAALPANVMRIDATACQRDGNRITVTGRLGIGVDPHPADPGHRAETYLIITLDPPVCLIEPDAPSGVPVPQAAFLTARPPLKSMMGVPQSFTGSLERGSEGTNQHFTFVTY